MTVWIGTSGWQYRDWRDAFYPHELPQRAWLQHYAAAFACVEVNNTFYNLPSEDAVQRWHDETPGDFRFILKASRYLTHIRRLRDPEEPVQTTLERFRPLGTRMAVILLQLPPRFRREAGRLDSVLRLFPKTVHVAVEFREASWFSDDVRDVLRSHGAALCVTDRGGETPEPSWDDLRWAYVRLHEGDGRPYPCYASRTLASWADRIAARCLSADDVYVFFNNDGRCCAPHDAARLAQLCERRGLEVSRTPPPRVIRPVR